MNSGPLSDSTPRTGTSIEANWAWTRSRNSAAAAVVLSPMIRVATSQRVAVSIAVSW